MSNRPDLDPTTNDATRGVHAVLIPGFWLGGWAWHGVEPALRAAGIHPHAITLPGLDGTPTEGITLDDHIEAVLQLIGGLEGDVVLVGHSGGGAVAQGAIDRLPDRVRRVVYVDSGPLIDGVALMPDVEGDVTLPTWDELAAQQSSIEGIDDAALARFRAEAVDTPGGVARSRIRLADERRLDVPVSVVCTSIPSETLLQLIESGQIPSELGAVRDVHLVDLPTGHWPMFSRAAELAAVIRDEILHE